MTEDDITLTIARMISGAPFPSTRSTGRQTMTLNDDGLIANWSWLLIILAPFVAMLWPW